MTHSRTLLFEAVDVTGPDTPLMVLFIHGSLDRSAGMARLTRLTQRRIRTVRFDRRGYGRQVSHAGPFTVDENAKDVLEILDGMPSVLIGHSYGGNIALRVAELAPHLVRGVSTYETPLSWTDWWPNDSAGAAAVSANNPEMAAERFMIRMIGQKRWDQLPEHTQQQRRKEGRALTGELSSLRSGSPWTGEAITCPVLCGYGSRALPHHIEGASALVRMLPQATMVCIEGAGHGAPISHPQDFCDQLVWPHVETI